VPAIGSDAPPSATNAFENIALAHREIYALYEIAQSMGTSLGVSDTMALISSQLTKIIPWSACALYLYQPESHSLTCRFASGVDAPLLLHTVVPGDSGPFGLGAPSRRVVVHGEARRLAASGVDPTQLQSAIMSPLHHNGEFIGCLALHHIEPGRYREDHHRLLERISEQAGPVIHNSIVFEQTHEDSMTDPLTGLPNRRSLFVHLKRELTRAERLKREVALVVMDIDGFKSINDSYGHHTGDQALREVAAALQEELRPYDLCVRYAGDEFVVVLADCGAAETRRSDLQRRIERISLEVLPGKLLTLAASAGAAVYPHDGTAYEVLLAEADHRMYRDKAKRPGGRQMPGWRAAAPHGRCESILKEAAPAGHIVA
jgi:diguanylate cyclase (GGDEF)-like protein